MENEETQYGLMEAFSFRKSVVKVSGQWLRFGKELEDAIRELSVGDSVRYVAEGRTLRRIEKAQPTPVVKQPQAPPVAPRPAPAYPVPAYAADGRNRSIERQTALKAAVELAQLLGYKTTDQCLGVAGSFAEWIESGAAGAQPVPSPRP